MQSVSPQIATKTQTLVFPCIRCRRVRVRGWGGEAVETRSRTRLTPSHAQIAEVTLRVLEVRRRGEVGEEGLGEVGEERSG